MVYLSLVVPMLGFGRLPGDGAGAVLTCHIGAGLTVSATIQPFTGLPTLQVSGY